MEVIPRWEGRARPPRKSGGPAGAGRMVRRSPSAGLVARLRGGGAGLVDGAPECAAGLLEGVGGVQTGSGEGEVVEILNGGAWSEAFAPLSMLISRWKTASDSWPTCR